MFDDRPLCKPLSSTFPSLTVLADGTLLAAYRVGSTKDSDDETIELRHSLDNGITWSAPKTPFATKLDSIQGSLKVGYITSVDDKHLLVVAMWVNRQTYPDKPLFNDATEGCLPIKIVLADSFDQGQSWSAWRVLSVPDDIGPPSLTNPVIVLPSGRLVISIETNKNYEDQGTWYQRVVYFYSSDSGQTWDAPVTICQDPTGRIFNWDQRTVVSPDGTLASFTWTYDRQTTKYLNIQRRLSCDEGTSWSTPTDLGFPDQAARPAMMPDGRIVLAWVDRFHEHAIKARLATSVASPFLASTEVELYRLASAAEKTAEGEGDTGDLLAEMGFWNFGLPFATALPDGDVLIVYYEGDAQTMQITWVRLAL